LPWMMYQDLVLGKKIRQSSHEVGIFWIHETADIGMLARRDVRRTSVREYLSPYFSKKVFAVLARDDLKPAMADWTRFLLSSCTYPIRWGAGLIRKLRHR
jgi:hypothetical protein